MWRSLVAHLTGGQGVAGSNPVIPTGTRTGPELQTCRTGPVPSYRRDAAVQSRSKRRSNLPGESGFLFCQQKAQLTSECTHGHGHDVVAVHNAGVIEPVGWADRHLRRQAADGAGDGRDRYLTEVGRTTSRVRMRTGRVLSRCAVHVSPISRGRPSTCERKLGEAVQVRTAICVVIPKRDHVRMDPKRGSSGRWSG
jgi:hypothetical protein